MGFRDQLVALQHALSGTVVPEGPRLDGRSRFWRIGRADGVVIEVVNPPFDPGVQDQGYVADRGDSVIITTPDFEVARFPALLAEARRQQRFWQQQGRFEVQLPSLLADPARRGRWVVFAGDEVIHAASTREQAHRWAVAHLDPSMAWVIAQVAVPHVHRVGGARRSMA